MSHDLVPSVTADGYGRLCSVLFNELHNGPRRSHGSKTSEVRVIGQRHRVDTVGAEGRPDRLVVAPHENGMKGLLQLVRQATCERDRLQGQVFDPTSLMVNEYQHR
jgi:hypothetical protein